MPDRLFDAVCWSSLSLGIFILLLTLLINISLLVLGTLK